jgi:hypothetical protein
VRLVERIKVSGVRRIRVKTDLRGVAKEVTIREANGELVVEIDEDGGLRDMAHRAIDSQGRRCKSGPLHVRFVGTISVREPLPDEVLPPATIGGRDDVFHGHAWASRPR